MLGVFLGLAPLAVFLEVPNAGTEISCMASAIFLILLPITEISAILLGYGLGRLTARNRNQARKQAPGPVRPAERERPSL